MPQKEGVFFKAEFPTRSEKKTLNSVSEFKAES